MPQTVVIQKGVPDIGEAAPDHMNWAKGNGACKTHLVLTIVIPTLAFSLTYGEESGNSGPNPIAPLTHPFSFFACIVSPINTTLHMLMAKKGITKALLPRNHLLSSGKVRNCSKDNFCRNAIHNQHGFTFAGYKTAMKEGGNLYLMCQQRARLCGEEKNPAERQTLQP